MNDLSHKYNAISSGKEQEVGQKRNFRFLLYGIITGAIFDVFFYNKTLGISYPAFILFIIITILVEFRKNLRQLDNKAWLLAIPVLLLSFTFFIYSNQVLKILNYLLIPVLLLIFIILLAKINKYDWPSIGSISDIAKRIFIPLRFIHRPFMELAEQGGNTENKGRASNRFALKILTGILISVPILALILWLLTSADLVFKNIFTNIPVLKIFNHFLVIISVTVYAASFIWALVKAFSERKEVAGNKRQRKLFLDPLVLLTILVLMNAVYGIFSYVQFAYLFGGSSYMLPSSLTYAEYARRGFTELIVVTIINFVILLFGITYVKKEAKRIFATVKILLTMLVFSTFIMLISAFYRTTLYEQAYGFTYLRIFVQAFMIMLFLLFIANIVYVWVPKLPIVKSYFIISLAVYILMNYANVDMIIARNNIARYFNTANIDLVYVKGLSWDAAGELKDFYISIKDSSDMNEKQMAEDIILYFNDKRNELEKIKSWQSFNISRNNALKHMDRTK